MLMPGGGYVKKLGYTIIAIVVIIGIYLGIGYYRSLSYESVGIPVLNYHQVNDKFQSTLTMPTEEFEREMAYLNDNGYHTISLDELYAYLHDGKPLPDKPIVLTFDDGYVDNYTDALPILEKYHMKATLFMIADDIDQPGFLTKEQLLDMEKKGYQVQSHTYSHRSLKTLSRDEQRDEFVVSKAILGEVMHHDIKYIAYPGGFTTPDTDDVMKDAEYLMGFTVKPGNAIPGTDLYELPRQAIFHNGITWYNFWMRLHYPKEVANLWTLRDDLVKWGYPNIAQYVPLF